MKRFLLALSLLTVSVSSSFGQCPAPEIAPWTDDLETMTATTAFTTENCWTATSTDAYDWNIDGLGSTPSSNTGPAGANSGANYFYVEASSGTAGVSTATLTSPQIDVTALTNPQLNFYYHMYGVLMGDLTVEAWDGATWNQVDFISGQQQTAQTDPWLIRTIDLSGYTGTIQIRFIALTQGSWEGDISLDDFSVIEAPACPFPTMLMASNVTATSADLSWQENGTATMWNVEYGPTGFTPGSGTLITGTMTNPESIAGLTAATQYDFYVQADCGADQSTWTGPFTFSTSFNTPAGVTCGTGFSTFVFSDDMETNTGWTGNIGTANAQWDFPTAAPGGNSTGTGPSGPASGTTFAEFEASGTTTTAASMVTPLIDLSSGSSEAELSFYMHAFGADIGTLNVGVGTSPTGPFTNVFSWSGQYQTAATDPWEHIGVDLTAYLGQQIYIEFNYAALASGFEGDLAIDLVQVETCVTCPAPTNFNLITADLTSADFDWVEAGAATTWELEYDLTAFTPGAGMDMLTTNNPETVSGLTSNSFYDVYVRSVCGPGDTSAYVGPISFNTFNQGQYMDWNTDCPMGGFYDISGTGTDLGLTDDSEAPIDPLPFPILFQGQLMTNATVGNNGGLQLGTTTANIGYGGNFTTLGDGTMFPWGDDLDSETGNVYWEVIGTSPNQVLIIQWDNTCNFPGSVTEPTVTFQIQIEEATGEIYYVYDDVVFGGTDAIDDYGANADIGISGPNQDYTVSTNDPQYLTDNSCVHFFYTNCPNPTNYTVIYTTFDEAGISWSAGLAGETDWTVIYGPAGFDPLTAGTTITTTAASAILTGLDDITTYDVYIYADCNPGTLQSNGVMGQFTTLPNCADPTGVTATTAPDSLFTSWGWTANPGFNSTGFNLQYGEAGFDLYTGTVVNADNNLTDTTFDATFLGGGVYEVYVQAVCGTDTSNFVGPIVFTMPLSNDSTCLAENLMVDGTVYTFNNSGASVQTGETGIAPPATGCQTTDGWCNTSINFSTWFTFTAPASGNVLISGSDEGFNGQVAVYETTDCSNFNAFTLLGANDDNVNTGAAAPEFILCGLTPGNTYYLMHDSWSTVTTGQYSLRLEEVAVNAGTTNGIIDVCTGAAVDLFNGITGNDAGGVWTEWIPTAGFSGSTFNSAGLAYQTFNFAYTVSEGCAVDSVQQQVQIYGPSSAGNDGVLDVCLNQPYDLVSGLSGNVDLGGTWYDPANNALASSALTAPNIPGQFNYDYITSNGVCPEDTSNVVVNVSSGCDWLNVEELYFSGIEVYPNPATDNIFISNLGADDVFSYELTDAQGKVIATKKDAINGTKITEIDVKNLEIGLYMIRVYNENAATTFRIVKQ